MNVRTALISSALLLAVLGWACEQQGPASPSALGTPGGSSLGGVTLDGGGGVRLASCKKEPDQPKCNGGGDGGGGGKKTFQATMTTDTGFPVNNRFTITTPERFPVDNKCNSGNTVDMDDINRRDVRDDSRLWTLTHLALEVKKCRNPFSGVKVWVTADDGTNFATRYLPGNPSVFLEDSFTLHVHANAWFFDTTTTKAFKLNIADIEYTAAP